MLTLRPSVNCTTSATKERSLASFAPTARCTTWATSPASPGGGWTAPRRGWRAPPASWRTSGPSRTSSRGTGRSGTLRRTCPGETELCRKCDILKIMMLKLDVNFITRNFQIKTPFTYVMRYAYTDNDLSEFPIMKLRVKISHRQSKIASETKTAYTSWQKIS